jgi:hypothetical protein
MNDLMALALVRKMLLELGFAMRPDASVNHIGALEVWLHEPVEQLGGMSPMQLLSRQDGPEQLRLHLAAQIVPKDQHEAGPVGDTEAPDESPTTAPRT